jgi:uncharacterized protein
LSSTQLKETIIAFGHENVSATHPSTLMITKDGHLTKTGDCIVAVSADKAPVDFNSKFKEKLKTENAKLTIIIEAGELKETIHAFGSPKFSLSHSVDMVIRKSDYISDRTVAIRADKSSSDLPIELLKKLKDPKQEIKITLIVD